MPRPNATATEIFYRWLEEEPADLEVFLEQACGGDSRIHEDVKELVHIHKSTDSFLQRPLFEERNDSGSATDPAKTNRVHDSAANDVTPVFESTAKSEEFPNLPRYEINGELGRGGMGVVYEARDVRLNRVVALKVASVGETSDAGLLARFRSEAQAMAELDHSNVVKVYEVGSHEGLSFLAMEYCPNGTLDTVRCDEAVGFRRAAEIVEQIARGVAAAHAQGLIHRDLKPANVLVDSQGGFKVADFGLVKREDVNQLTATGVILGTPFYMSPEQADRQKRVGPATDVWSLGVILYQLLTNEVPFSGDDPFLVIHRVLKEDPNPPTAVNARIPRDLEVICLKCLSKEPAGRYVAANALADDLRRWLDGIPIEARPATRSERTWKWVRRNPALASAILFLIFGIAVSVLFATEARRERDQKEKALEQALTERNQAKAAREETETFAGFLVEDFLGAAGIRDVEAGMLPNGRGRTIEETLHVASKRIASRFVGAPIAEARARHAFGVAWEHIGDYDEAERNLRRASKLRLGALEENVETYVGFRQRLRREAIDSHNRLGLVLIRSGRSGEALEFLQEALSLAKGHLGETDSLTLDCRTNLGLACQEIGRPEEARHQFEEVIRLAVEDGTDSGFRNLRHRSNLARAFLKLGHVNRAVALLENVVDESVDQFGGSHPFTRGFRYELAKAHLGSGQLDKALPVLERELEDRERDYTLHPLTLEVMSTLGKAYEKADRLQDAARVLDTTVRMIELHFGAGHPRAILPRTNLGVVYAKLGNKEQGTKIVRLALDKSVSTLGREHPTTLVVQQRLTKLETLTEQTKTKNPLENRDDQQISSLEEAIRDARSRYGPHHPLTLEIKIKLGKALRSRGRLDEAIDLLEQALEQSRTRTRSWQNDLALAYAGTDRFDKAIPLLEKMVRHAEEDLGEAHPTTLDLRGNLGIVYRDADALSKAIDQFETVLRHTENSSTTTQRRVEWVKVHLAEGYDSTTQWPKSEPLRRSILETVRNRFGPTHHWTGHALEKLGDNLIRQKQYQEAEKLLREAVKIRKKTTPGSWRVGRAELSLGEALVNLRKYQQAEPVLQRAERIMINAFRSPATVGGELPPKSRQDALLRTAESLLSRLADEKNASDTEPRR